MNGGGLVICTSSLLASCMMLSNSLGVREKLSLLFVILSCVVCDASFRDGCVNISSGSLLMSIIYDGGGGTYENNTCFLNIPVESYREGMTITVSSFCMSNFMLLSIFIWPSCNARILLSIVSSWLSIFFGTSRERDISLYLLLPIV